MKTIITACLLLLVITAKSQNAKFESAISKNLEQMNAAKTLEDMQTATNSFERIAAAEPKEWLAQYYAGMSNILTGMRQESNDKKDEHYDKALSYIDKADGLQADNSEIYVLKSWALAMKIGIDPANRGMTLGPESGMMCSKAKELNDANPRAYYLMGQSAMYTPEQYGGGKDKAIMLLETAVKKFKTFKPSSPIMPTWGEKQAIDALEQCKKM